MGRQSEAIMAEYWNTFKASAIAAGDQAQRGAQRTKLAGEIMYLKNKVDNQKREFGVAVFDHMRSGEQEIVQQFLQQYQATVGALEEQIAAKQAEIEALGGQAASSAMPSGGVASTGPV